MLLTDRLYFKQVGQAQPDATRLQKVKLTMARIKVVLGERERALEAWRVDQKQKMMLTGHIVPAEMSRWIVPASTVEEGSSTSNVAAPSAVPGDKSRKPRTELTDAEQAAADAKLAKYKSILPEGAALPPHFVVRRKNFTPEQLETEIVKAKAMGRVISEGKNKKVMVTYKRFGRKITAPIEEMPSHPTRAEQIVADKAKKWFYKSKARTERIAKAQEKAGVKLDLTRTAPQSGGQRMEA